MTKKVEVSVFTIKGRDKWDTCVILDLFGLLYYSSMQRK